MLVATVIILSLFTLKISSLVIPSDVEILDGYDMYDFSVEYPESEIDSLSSYDYKKPIRNKRSLYKDEEMSAEKSNDAKEESMERIRRNQKLVGNKLITQLPVPEKQVMEPEFYKRRTWDDYNNKRIDYHDDGDSIGDSTSNEGIRGRTPRVNFITQSKNNNLNDNDRRLTPEPFRSRYHHMNGYMDDLYPSRSYDPYLRRYDRYDDQYNRNDLFYENFYLNRKRFDPYDSYSPRSPYFEDRYYNYPDERYDIPEPRQIRPPYDNGMQSYDFESSLRSPKRRTRIIYYAHLPEIVRLPPYNRYNRPPYNNDNNVGPTSAALRVNENPSRDRYDDSRENFDRNRPNYERNSPNPNRD